MFKCVLSGIADVFCPAFGPNQCALSRPSAGDELARIFTTAAIGFGAETIVPIIFPGTPVCFGLGRAWRQVALSNRGGRYNEKQKEEE